VRLREILVNQKEYGFAGDWGLKALAKNSSVSFPTNVA
jgi:hypothetical protein